MMVIKLAVATISVEIRRFGFSPRSGGVNLARPFKAGSSQGRDIVALATFEHCSIVADAT
jgi:hypothetical protein